MLYPIDDDYARESTSVGSKDPSLLQDEFVRLSADLATWNARYAEASEAYLEADTSFDFLAAELSREWRAEFVEGGTKHTEAGIKERVESDKRYLAARRARNSAEVEKTRMRGMVDAVQAKKDMIVSLGATIRMEMSSNPSLRMQMGDQQERDNQ